MVAKIEAFEGVHRLTNASINITPQQVNIGHMDFGAMISNSPKVTTLVFGCLMSIRAQLQDLGGIMGPPLQDRLEVLHFLTVVWLDKPSGRPPSTLWPNGPKTE